MLVGLIILLLIGIVYLGYENIKLQGHVEFWRNCYNINNQLYSRRDTMPMKKGSSSKVISENIKEGMDSYKEKGTFGNSKPKNAKAAQKQIIAASYSNAGRSKSKPKKKK